MSRGSTYTSVTACCSRSRPADIEDLARLGGFGQRAEDDLRLVGRVRIVEQDLEHEPVDLGLGQRIRALGFDRVLGGQDEERGRDLEGVVADRDLVLLHDLEQCRLDLGRGAVDLVGEEEVREDGAGLDVEAGLVGAVDPRPDEIGGHEIGRELDALERAAEDVGEGLDRERLGQARDTLEEEVAARQQADQDPLEHLVLTDDDPPDLEHDGFGGSPRIGRIGEGSQVGAAGCAVAGVNGSVMSISGVVAVWLVGWIRGCHDVREDF